MKFDFNEIPNGFLVELNYQKQKISSENELVNERVNELSLNERSILDYIINQPEVTQEKLAENLKLSE